MLLLFADDLTGGNDAGIQFAKLGLPTRLFLSDEHINFSDLLNEAVQTLALNTNTRNAAEAEAKAVIGRIVKAIQPALSQRPLVFKKIDSTLRGNFGAEADLLMDGFGFETAFLAPAYPRLGRITRDGQLLVDNVPLQLTAFAKDPLAPPLESSALAIVKAQSAKKAFGIPIAAAQDGREAIKNLISGLAAEGIQIFVFDAENDAQLDEIAAAALYMQKPPMLIGSAGLAAATARILSAKLAAAPVMPPPVEKAFFICGSAHEATHAQIRLLAEKGIPVVRLPENIIKNTQTSPEIAANIIKILERGSAVLAMPEKRLQGSNRSQALCEDMASLAMDVLKNYSPQKLALVFSGGETACAVLRQMCAYIIPRAEPLPGVALCSIGDGKWSGLPVATKAGGFGAADTLVELLSMLQS